MADEKTSEWNATFQLLAPIHENSIKGVESIEFDIEESPDGGIKLKGFVIRVPSLVIDDAFLYAQAKANRIFDYLRVLHGYPIQGFLASIVENKPTGEIKQGYTRVSIDTIIHKSFDVDFSSIKDVLENNDIKLSRQLAHYSMGLESKDVVTKVSQFFQVAEDEYSVKRGKPAHPFIKKYRWVRNIVSHPTGDFEETKTNAEKIFGKNYIDLSDPSDMDKLEKALEPIEKEAREILERKIGGPIY
ncbi:MAG: hypothetical protein WCY97_03945 [Methanothrix sp.]|jgi:hypothetical protein|uniref:Uncharacterized protein n=1 Tax=Methanothrix harundinacea TaxID=301375 RepID=A0A101ILD0_9EURY|nr:MAG: hypothetical protein XE07_0436 [Methanothrix harundinacea]MDD2638184.1 hypothetical protein [Methanothrix sp.]MDI9398024.1 hypothetical protein [Euryarchaeota archaeon]MCP1391924.1 hypothetical protein [Methanothrix harundinacea]MDD3709978.1 hypothetical protein [Methanothrix sp.]